MIKKTLINGLLILVLSAFFCAEFAYAKGLQPNTPEYQASLLQDYQKRVAMLQTDLPLEYWYTDPSIQKWGPLAKKYPNSDDLVSALPKGTNIQQWKRDRVVAVAKTYINLPYRHHHIPAWNPQVPNGEGLTGPGLDCSNFTSWVYNFGFGIMLNSDVVKQAQMIPSRYYPLPDNIRRLSSNEDFLPGDLLYIYNPDKTAIAHVIIFIDEGHIIDSTKGRVDVRNFTGWYRERLSHGVRIFN